MGTLKKVLKTLAGIAAALILVPILLVALIAYENYDHNPPDGRDRGHWPEGERKNLG